MTCARPASTSSRSASILQPTRKHAAIDRFVPPEEFEALETIARAKGFLMVSASPLTRSSHHAGEDFARLQAGPPRPRTGTHGRLRHSLTRVLALHAGAALRPRGRCGALSGVHPLGHGACAPGTAARTGRAPRLLDAEAQVKFSIVRERFATRVRLDEPCKKPSTSICFRARSSKLQSRWRFNPHAKGCATDLRHRFRVRLATFSNACSRPTSSVAVDRIIGAFERRAKSLYN